MTTRHRLRIHYRNPSDPHGLVGVERLIRCVLDLQPDIGTHQWTVERGAWGHGEHVCAIEDSLEATSVQPIDLSTLLLALDSGQYFEHGKFEVEAVGITVEVFDSSFLQLSGPADLIEHCRRQFVDVEVLR